MTDSIFSVIAKVSGELVGRLSTDKRNTQQNYDYISADLVLQEAGRAMAANGLVIIPSITEERLETVEYTDSYGKNKTRYDALVCFSMVIAASGEQIVSTWTGRGSDYAVPDKATYKAITSGHKYFLMKLFNIGVGNEDGEHDQAEAVGSTRKPPAQPQRQATKAQPAAQGAPRDVMTVKGEILAASLKGSAAPAKENQLKFVRASLGKLVKDDADKAKAVLAFMFGINSTTELTAGQASALIDWAGANKDNGYTVSVASAQEAERIVNARYVDEGQAPLFDEDMNGAYIE